MVSHTRDNAGIAHYALVEPSRDERAILAHARAHVASLGLTLPPHTIRFFSDADFLSDLSAGRTLARARPITILLASALPAAALFRIATHEWQHCADAVRYSERAMTVDEYEERAEVLSALATELCRLRCPTGPVNRSAR